VPPRRGSILIIFLVCLLLLSLTVGVLVRATLLHRDHIRTALPQLQAEWMAHSAAELAATRLQADPGWSGDTWTIAPDELSSDEAAAVSVSVVPVPDDPQRRTLQITVDYPPDSPQRVRVQHTLLIDIPSA
jgi:hypothetical protein